MSISFDHPRVYWMNGGMESFATPVSNWQRPEVLHRLPAYSRCFLRLPTSCCKSLQLARQVKKRIVLPGNAYGSALLTPHSHVARSIL